MTFITLGRNLATVSVEGDTAHLRLDGKPERQTLYVNNLPCAVIVNSDQPRISYCDHSAAAIFIDGAVFGVKDDAVALGYGPYLYVKLGGTYIELRFFTTLAGLEAFLEFA